MRHPPTHLVLLLAALAAACSRPPPDATAVPLVSGGTLAQRTRAADYTVALVMDPSTVFTCGTHVSRWVAWARHNPGHFALVFTRAPIPAEARKLALDRVHADETFATPLPMGRGTAREILLGHGRPVLSEEVRPGTFDTMLLKAAEEDRVPELLDPGHIERGR